MTALLTAVSQVLREVFVVPVRDGRIRASGWPPGLAGVVGLALVAFGVASALVLAAPAIRRHTALDVALGGEVIYPRGTLFVFLALTAVTLALLHAASLHLAVWLRLASLLVVGMCLVCVPISPLISGPGPHLVSWTGAALLAILTVVRWRHEFRWWEFVASLLVVGGTMAVVLRLVADLSQPVGLDTAPAALTLTMQVVAALAVPFTVVAGLAFAQLALLIAGRVGSVVDERVTRTWPIAALVLAVAAVDLVVVLRHQRGPTATGASRWAESGSSLLLLLLALGVGALILRRTGDDPSLDRLERPVALLALPVALLVTVTSIPGLMAARLHTQVVRWTGSDPLHLDDLRDLLTDDDVRTWTRAAVGAALLGWAWWQRRRGPTAATAALLAATIGLTLLVTEARRATGGAVDLPWTVDTVNDGAVVLAVLALTGLVLARRMTRARLVALGTVLGIALAWGVRTTFDAPFVAVFGLGATAAVFLGVLWAAFTGAEDANEHSARYPRPARVLLFLGNALLAMTVLAFLAVTRAGRVGLDVSAYAGLGDLFLGTGVLLAAYVLLVRVATRPESPRC